LLKENYQSLLSRFLIIGITLFPGTSLAASSEDSVSQSDSIATENSEEECFCSVRKRKQVENRLKKKKQPDEE